MTLLKSLTASCLLCLIITETIAQVPYPPNGFRISENTYIDKTEVSNINWLEYLHYIEIDSGKEKVLKATPRLEVTQNYRANYLYYPYYKHYPVVGISQEQAIDYCKWRSAIVNKKLAEDNKLYRVNYRLPTEKEWETTCQFYDTLKMDIPKIPLVKKVLKYDKGQLLELFPDKKIDYAELRKGLKRYLIKPTYIFVVAKNEPWFITQDEKLPQSVYQFEKGKERKLHHLMGNVAELIDESGIVKGGSWRHDIRNCFPSKRIQIDPENVYDWVGFRCVADVYEITD